MGYKVDNAVIMAAGLSNRFAPISYEKPKALVEVKGEILIERQIRQLQEKGINTIIVVTGYKQEQFHYLKDKYNLIIVENKEFMSRNNNSSIRAAEKYIRNSYICSADNYFSINPFENEVEEAYYSALFSPGEIDEWCLTTDDDDYITGITIGGNSQWYMLGHVFWSEEFSRRFLDILQQVYEKEETRNKLWEEIYMDHLSQLRMKMRRYSMDEIYEFDSLDELRLFDKKYENNSGSTIMAKLSEALHCTEAALTDLKPLKDASGNVIGVIFSHDSREYSFLYGSEKLTQI